MKARSTREWRGVCVRGDSNHCRKDSTRRALKQNLQCSSGHVMGSASVKVSRHTDEVAMSEMSLELAVLLARQFFLNRSFFNTFSCEWRSARSVHFSWCIQPQVNWRVAYFPRYVLWWARKFLLEWFKQWNQQESEVFCKSSSRHRRDAHARRVLCTTSECFAARTSCHGGESSVRLRGSRDFSSGRRQRARLNPPTQRVE